MPTDEERRDVARRLRDSAEERMAVKGTGNGNNWSWLYRSIFGHYMGTKNGAKGHYVEVAHRLADLIEPSGHECVPGECPINVRHDNDCIDRDALLALADEIYDTSCDNHGELTVDLIDIWGWSQAICEALEVQDA